MIRSLAPVSQHGEPRNSMAKNSGTTASAAGRDPSTEPIAAGIFAFEGDWETDLRDPWSIEPMLHALEFIGELKCIRRNVATVPELEHYVDKWLQKRYAGYQVGYFGFHGMRGSLSLGGKRYVSLEDLETMIDGRAEGRIIHFGSCSVMRVDGSRLKKFQESTRARAVIGYTRDVNSDLNWAAFEILLLEALSRYRQTGAPARHLSKNHGHLCDKLGFKYIY